ncbi:MAG: hypothetical protein ACTSV3_00290 [Candidatus Thorarchaeota archaeon]|nr:MAG: hypothetical protein DRP09_05270 [Candidatus Thorarchaeota archaeon]
MHPRIAQLFGVILVIVSAAMTYVVYQGALLASPGDLFTLLASGLVTWAILAMPELIIGLWLFAKGTRESRIHNVSGLLIPLVQKEGRISVEDAAREMGVTPQIAADAAESLAKRPLPLVYLDRGAHEIVSPKAVSLKESLLHLLYAQRRMTFDSISAVTESTDEQIVDALKELSKAGRFRGVIDENSRVVYTAEAVAQLKKAITKCPNCDGKLESPVLPGEEEECPYCGHLIVNRG